MMNINGDGDMNSPLTPRARNRLISAMTDAERKAWRDINSFIASKNGYTLSRPPGGGRSSPAPPIVAPPGLDARTKPARLGNKKKLDTLKKDERLVDAVDTLKKDEKLVDAARDSAENHAAEVEAQDRARLVRV